jgi:CheY-like chemotaxis protein
MGGTIHVESALDVGTTFTIDLGLTEGPLERYERLRSDSSEEPRSRPRRRVLQIEDNVSNVKLVERIMERRPDIELLTAGGGRAGLEMARANLPDLVLLDLHLPDIPGHEVLRGLRADPRTRQIPVIVVSADATKTQVDRLRAAGVFGYLTKPLDVAEFLSTIDRAIHGDGIEAADGATGTSPEAS